MPHFKCECPIFDEMMQGGILETGLGAPCRGYRAKFYPPPQRWIGVSTLAVRLACVSIRRRVAAIDAGPNRTVRVEPSCDIRRRAARDRFFSQRKRSMSFKRILSARPPLFQTALIAAGVSTLLCVGAGPMRSNIAGITHAPQPIALDDRDGKYKTDDEHARDIRWLLADISDRAANDDGWNRVSDWLSSKDRHRIEDGIAAAKTGDYAKYAHAFREAWKKKYDSNFNAHKNMDDITGVKIEFMTDGGVKMATATFPAFGGMKPFEMRLQLEAKDKWRIEVPNSLDAQKYVDGLQDGLKNIVDRKESMFDEEKLGLNSAITQMLHGLSFEQGAPRSAKAKR